MEKSVLISIHPEWCERILAGEKTIEVRKNNPTLPHPFTCYIYCTKTTGRQPGKIVCLNRTTNRLQAVTPVFLATEKPEHLEVVSGKIIGEFTCDSYVHLLRFTQEHPDTPVIDRDALSKACLSEEAAVGYAHGMNLIGWHIADLKIYDKPLELADFGRSVAPMSWHYVRKIA